MDSIILDNIPFKINMEQLLKELHVKKDSKYAERLDQLVQEASRIARPLALFREAYIEQKGEDSVVVDGVTLNSRILRVNLGQSFKVFPFIVTSGVELEEWSKSFADMLEHFWADTLKERALECAHSAFKEHLAKNYNCDKMAEMHPGSLADWPLPEQRKVFSLLGSPLDTIGVELKDSLLMYPLKTVSGIRFPNEENFESCQLCLRDRCPNRKAPCDKSLYDLCVEKETS